MKTLLPVFVIFNMVTMTVFANELAPELHRDPFVNPLLQQQVSLEEVVEAVRTTESPTTDPVPRESFLWQPELRGIIRSEDIAIANIGGKMVGLGEEIDGYRLIKVKERSVVFEKNGKYIPVSLDNTDEEKDAL